MKLTFKQFLEEAKKTDNQYPVKGARKIVDHSKEKTDKAYRSANSLNSTAPEVGGGRV